MAKILTLLIAQRSSILPYQKDKPDFPSSIAYVTRPDSYPLNAIFSHYVSLEKKKKTRKYCKFTIESIRLGAFRPTPLVLRVAR